MTFFHDASHDAPDHGMADDNMADDMSPHSRFLSSCSILGVLDRLKIIIVDMTFHMAHVRPSSSTEYYFLLYLSSSSMHMVSKLLLHLDAADGIFSFSAVRPLLRDLDHQFSSRLSLELFSAMGFRGGFFDDFLSYADLDLPDPCISFFTRLSGIRDRIAHFDCLVGLVERSGSDMSVGNVNDQIARLSAAFSVDDVGQV